MADATPPPPRTVLFVCVHNAARSLMAEAIFNARPPPGWIAVSAGTAPAAAPHVRTARLLAEIGLDLPPHSPQALTPSAMDAARVRVTMGCLDDASCPAHLRQLELRDWALPDPTTLDDDGFRAVREAIREKVERLRLELTLTDRRLGRGPSAGGT